MRATRSLAVCVSLLGLLVTACATADQDPPPEPAASDGEAEAPEATPPAEGSSGGRSEAYEGFAVAINGSTIEVTQDDGAHEHGWTLGDGRRFHSFLVHPGSTADAVDVAALALDGERSVLVHVYVRADGESGIADLPDHLQPQHDVDAGPPVIAWTPDGRSLVWTEPSSDGVVLRAVGWQDGPGTGRAADDNASFVLDVPGGVHVDGFDVTSSSSWTLTLRGGVDDEPIDLVVERQSDGALALPVGG